MSVVQVRSRSQAAQEELDLDRPDFLPAGMPAAVAKATRNPYDARPSLPQRRMFRPPPPSVKGQVSEGTAAGKADGDEQSQAQRPPSAATPAAEPPQQTDAVPQDSPPRAAFRAAATEMEAAVAPFVAPPAHGVDELRLPQPGPIRQNVDEIQLPQQAPPVQADPTVHGATPLRPEPGSLSNSDEENAATNVRASDNLHTAEAVEHRPETDSDDAQAPAGNTELRGESSEAHAAPSCPPVLEAGQEATSKEVVAPDQLEQTPETVSLSPDCQTNPRAQ